MLSTHLKELAKETNWVQTDQSINEQPIKSLCLLSSLATRTRMRKKGRGWRRKEEGRGSITVHNGVNSNEEGWANQTAAFSAKRSNEAAALVFREWIS